MEKKTQKLLAEKMFKWKEEKFIRKQKRNLGKAMRSYKKKFMKTAY